MANALALSDPRLQKPAGPIGTMPAPPPIEASARAPMKANALSAPTPYMPAQKKPQNALIGAAVDGFQRGFDPAGRQQQIDQSKADGMEKAKQTLTLMQQQRQLPTEQRVRWWTENAPQIGQIIGQDLSQQQVDPNAFTDEALDGQIALLSGKLGIAPAAPEPMSEYEAAQIALKEQEASQPRNQFIQGPDGAISVGNLNDGTVRQLQPGQPKPDPANYDMVTTADGIVAVNKRDPSDRIMIGAAPAKPGSDGLSDYQALQFQFKLDDLDRDLADRERTRKTSLGTVDGSIALLDKFTGDENTFNEVYGNWINPTGEGDDFFNPRVAPGSARANGIAILEQLGGRAFLDSIAAMRGTGPLSDREGARVTAAATRLTSVTQSDDAAKEAAKEFRNALVAYKAALEQDIASSRTAETGRRQQMQTMMGRQPGAAEVAPSRLSPDEEEELRQLEEWDRNR